MNKPYVKQYNEVGELLNPIERYYESKTYLGMRKGLIPNTVVPYFDCLLINKYQTKQVCLTCFANCKNWSTDLPSCS